jgi:hypothetical protein
MKLHTFLLRMRDLKDRHSGVYLNEVLLELLKKFDIELDIIK